MNYLIQRTYTFTITRDSILFLLVFIFNFSTLPVYLFRSSKRDRRLWAWHVLDCAFVNTNSMHTRVLESNQPTFSYSRVSHFDRLELFIWGAGWLQKKKKRRKNTNNSFFLFFFFSKDIDFYVCFAQITKPPNLFSSIFQGGESISILISWKTYTRSCTIR